MIKIPSTEWNLVDLFENDTDPLIEREKENVNTATDAFVSKWAIRNDYLDKATILLEALDEYEYWARKYGTDGKIGLYFMLRMQCNQLDDELKAKYNKIDEFSRNNANKIQFFTIRLAKIKKEKQIEFLNAAELQKYKHFLEQLFNQSKYTLSEQEEKILTLKSGPAQQYWVKMTATLLSKEEATITNEDGKKETLSFAEILNTLSLSKSKSVRNEATDKFNAILEKHSDVAVNEINAILADKKINDELRGAERPDTMRLLSEDIEPQVVDALIEAVSEQYTLSHEFYKLKAKMLGVNKLQYNERNVEVGDLQSKYTYENAISLIENVFDNLDIEFKDIFVNMIENGQVDVYPKKGKKSGAFCVYHMLDTPTYVFLNHTDNINDVLTIAHEFGHAINGELMKQNCNALTYDTPMATAEVASTFMEDFVLEELEKSADDATKLSLIMMKLNDDVSTIFRQIACYKFEQDLHAAFRDKGYLSKNDIGTIFKKNMSDYMGEAVEQSIGSENWWIYWSHIRSYFYVYSYASGLLISKSLQHKVRKDPNFINDVKEFLKAGTTQSPKEIFQKLGIDITKKEFWIDGLKEIESLLSQAKKLSKYN